MKPELKHKDIRMGDKAVIDAFPIYNIEKKVLSVGAGQARSEWYASTIGYDVLCTDIVDHLAWEENESFRYEYMDIFNPIMDFQKPIVICCEVLEHLKTWHVAIKNLIELTTKRLIITVPFKTSFYSPGHINFWNDKSIKEFNTLCKPYSVAISKVKTKAADINKPNCRYLIVMDKTQVIQ